MSHFPQTDSNQRSPRVQLNGSVAAPVMAAAGQRPRAVVPKAASARAQNYNAFRSTAACCSCSTSFPPEISSRSLSTPDLAPSTVWPKCCTRRASFRARVCSLSALLPWPTTTTASCVWRSIPLWTAVSWTRFPSRFRRRRDSDAGGGLILRRLSLKLRATSCEPRATGSLEARSSKPAARGYTDSSGMTSQSITHFTHSAEETIAFGLRLAVERSEEHTSEL